MNYLIISILCSVAVSVLLKISRSKKIDIEQAVAVNYLVAVSLTMAVLQPDLSTWQSYLPTWWLFAALGVLLPSVFVIMGRAVQQAGIVKSDAAQRLSLFLPVAASFLIFNETPTTGRLIGLPLPSFHSRQKIGWHAFTSGFVDRCMGGLRCYRYSVQTSGQKRHGVWR